MYIDVLGENSQALEELSMAPSSAALQRCWCDVMGDVRVVWFSDQNLYLRMWDVPSYDHFYLKMRINNGNMGFGISNFQTLPSIHRCSSAISQVLTYPFMQLIWQGGVSTLGCPTKLWTQLDISCFVDSCSPTLHLWWG